MKNLGFLFISIFLTSPAIAYVGVKASLSSGSVEIGGQSLNLQGYETQFQIVGRIAKILDLGVFGEYENFALTGVPDRAGSMELFGYGALARIFFFSKIFMMATYGQTQAVYKSEDNPQVPVIADATFLTLGPGFELALSKNTWLDFALEVKNYTFPNNEFKKMNLIQYSLNLGWRF